VPGNPVALPVHAGDVQIEHVDPCDDRAFADWFAVVDASDRAERPHERRYAPEELRAQALHGRPADDGSPPPDELVELLLARDGDRPVGAVQVELPLRDNAHAVFFLLRTDPGARRRGAGTALLEAVHRRARAAGRTTAMTELDEPADQQGGAPGRAFAARHGYAQALVEVRRLLDLPVPAERLEAVEAEARSRADGYRLLSWRDRVPDQHVDDRAALARGMSNDVPLGDLTWGEEAWDAARVRRRENLVAAQGRTMLGAGAVHEQSGRMVAFTEAAVVHAIPERVNQWETFVLGAHRGHRLGTLVKTSVLRRIADELPEARSVVTTNADSNGPMIAVNERLGFRVDGLLLAYQREL
jgi:GNAT superfamily N-acetyltransferase